MSSHVHRAYPRSRKTAKWLVTIVAALLFIAWLASGKWGIVHHAPTGHSISLWRGRVWFFQPDGPVLTSSRSGEGFEWRSGPVHGLDLWMSSFNRYNQPILTLPVWWAALPATALAAALWRHDIIAIRRWRLRYCMKCGYDRAGLASDAVCPECGNPRSH